MNKSKKNNPFAIPDKILLSRLLPFIESDIGFGDLSSGIIPEGEVLKAKIIAKTDGILAGSHEAHLLFEYLGLKVEKFYYDGDAFQKGSIIMTIEGNLRNTLMVERTSLNILMKLSSIATSTHDLVQITRNNNLNTLIATTRKVTPGFGWFEKKAVYFGGGDTHRWNLSDMVMFKDTHLAYYNGNITSLLKNAKQEISFSKKIELEIENPDDIEEAISAGADIIMLDNMTPNQIKIALSKVSSIRKKVLFEASGNITYEELLDYARSGVDIISTSSMILRPHKYVDFSLRLEK